MLARQHSAIALSLALLVLTTNVAYGSKNIMNSRSAPQVSARSMAQASKDDAGTNIEYWNDWHGENGAPLVTDQSRHLAQTADPGIPLLQVATTQYTQSSGPVSARTIPTISPQDAELVAAAGLGPAGPAGVAAAMQELADDPKEKEKEAARQARQAEMDASWSKEQEEVRARLTKNFVGKDEGRAWGFLIVGFIVTIIAIAIIWVAERLWLMQSLGIPMNMTTFMGDESVAKAMYPFL
mmetsp:Transcript_49500/g.130345  ORF Transcript_49500/g.130345 Transcript_49500/m.130345 type:complete len:239 (-) Transcript_49500:33-749(-)